MAILITDKVNFRAKKFTRDTERHYKMTKKSIHKEYITILNVNAPNNKVL